MMVIMTMMLMMMMMMGDEKQEEEDEEDRKSNTRTRNTMSEDYQRSIVKKVVGWLVFHLNHSLRKKAALSQLILGQNSRQGKEGWPSASFSSSNLCASAT